MANHGKTERPERYWKRHYAKPSRQKRHERRYDARTEEMRRYFETRDYAFRVGPYVSKVWPRRNDVERVFRIAEYLAKRAERRATQQRKAA